MTTPEYHLVVGGAPSPDDANLIDLQLDTGEIVQVTRTMLGVIARLCPASPSADEDAQEAA